MVSASSPGSDARPLRSRGRTGRARKVGWQVSHFVAEAVKEAVENGAAESQNAFVEDALLRRLKELRREKIYAAYAEAARDGAFMHDMRSATEAFDVTSGDGLA